MYRFLFFILITLLYGCRDVEVYDFESQFSGLEMQTPPTPYAISRVTDIVRRGKYSARFELRQGEKWKNSYRSEYMELFNASYDKEYWYGISIYIPSSFPIHDNRNVIMQWHAQPDIGEVSRSPVLSFKYINGNLLFDVRHSTKKIQERNDAQIIPIGEIQSFEKGKWADFIINVKWSYDKAGFVNIFMNGRRIVHYIGPVGYNDDKGPYVKFGIYRKDVPYTYVIYFDEYRRGHSYKDVDPSNINN